MNIKEAIVIMGQVIEARSDGIESEAWEIVKIHLPTTDNSESVPCSNCRFRHNELHCGYCIHEKETEYGDYYEKE